MSIYYNKDGIILYKGHILDELKNIGDNTIHCVVTSPPYWGLRNYEIDPVVWKDSWCGSLGLEPTPGLYVEHMVAVFREVRRVLRRDGTLWLNMGDGYAHSGACGGSSPDGPRKPRATDRAAQEKMKYQVPPGLKPKDLVGIPWRVAFALQADGWYLRSDIIWSKPNPMPESVQDRPTKSHEYIFLLTKSGRYYWDPELIREPHSEASYLRAKYSESKDRQKHGIGKDFKDSSKAEKEGGFNDFISEKGIHLDPFGSNSRDVWVFTTHSFPDAHFATFPEKLPEKCILAGTSEYGICPTCGKQWERIIENKDLDPDWVKACGGDENGYRGQATKDYETAFAQNPSDTKRSILESLVNTSTIGWKPNCSCYKNRTIFLPPIKKRPHHIKHSNLIEQFYLFWNIAKNWEVDKPIVMDPFNGSGTTGLVATKLGCNYIGIDLKDEYLEMSLKRILPEINKQKYSFGLLTRQDKVK